MPVNNNPFTFRGRIHRTSYAIVAVILKIITCLSFLVINLYYKLITAGVPGEGYEIILTLATALLIFTTVLLFFCTIKRLRDVKHSAWWSLLILLGPVYIILFIYLVIVPSKWDEDNLNLVKN